MAPLSVPKHKSAPSDSGVLSTTTISTILCAKSHLSATVTEGIYSDALERTQQLLLWRQDQGEGLSEREAKLIVDKGLEDRYKDLIKQSVLYVF